MNPFFTRLIVLLLGTALFLPLLAGCSKPAENPAGQTARERHDQINGAGH